MCYTNKLPCLALPSFDGEEVIAQLLMVLTGLSTEEVLQISEAGIEVTDVEAQRFRGKFLFKYHFS